MVAEDSPRGDLDRRLLARFVALCTARSVGVPRSELARAARRKDYDRGALRYQSLIIPAFIAACVLAVVLGRARGAKKRAAVPPRRPPPVFTPAEVVPPPPEPPFGPLRQAGAELPCDVDEAFAKKCRRCHGTPTRHGAPLTFYTWEDTHKLRGDAPVYKYIGRAVATDAMPFRTLTNPPIEPLTAAETTAILDWVAAGAPRGNCEPAAAPSTKPASSGRRKPRPPAAKSAQPSNSAVRTNGTTVR
jgi:hypothetical protein